MSAISITIGGPIFHEGPEIIHAFLGEAKDALAAQAMADVHLVLDRSIKHPTPYYETQIKTERQGEDRVVDDSGVIYGPWLEGTGSRNATTRFKGYAAFRKARQELQGKAPRIVESILPRYLKRLGG